MKNVSLFLGILAASVFTAYPLVAQKVVNTNASAPPNEASQRAFAEIIKIQQRTTQMLAETEAATRTNISYLTTRDGSLETAYLLKQQRLVVVKSLIGVIESTNTREVKDSAAMVLGDYRALEAIPCLVSNIQQDTMFKWDTVMMTEAQRKPFGAALANIGEPAVPALLDHITVVPLVESERVADHCLEVMVRIIGKERAAALLRARMEALNYPELDERFKRLLAKTQT